MRQFSIGVAVLFALGSGCNACRSTGTPVDVGMDAQSLPSDAGSQDAAASDAHTQDGANADAAVADAAIMDAQVPDATPLLDAAMGDGAVPDAAPIPDASPMDASVPDAAPLDAATADAALAPDAGSNADAASPGLVLSYLGGAGNHPVDDQARDVAVDTVGNIYVAGGLFGHTGTFFSGATHRRTISGASRGSEDIFVVKLTPDGTLVYATLMGGPGYDRPYGIEVDAAGVVTLAGRAGSGFPTTPGCLQPNFAGDNNANGAYGTQDGFVARLAADGSLAWATYLGDPGPAFIRDVAIDAQGNAYVGVTLVDAAFPYVTAGSFGPAGSTGSHAALVKLDPTGSMVVWGGHLGGPALTLRSGDRPTVRVANGDVFVIYTTVDPAEPVTPLAFQRTLAGGVEAVVARVLGDGTGLVYLTYLGGTGDEGVETHQMEVDAAGRVHVALPSSSTRMDAVVPAGALQQTSAGMRDVLVARLSADGSAVEAATFFGGSGNDNGEGIALDPRNGNIVFTGITQSTDFPATGAALPQGTLGDAIVVVLRPALDVASLVYAARVGGAGSDDQLRSVAVDTTGAIVAAGNTNSMSLPTVHAVQTQYGGGGHDAWWLRLPTYP